MKRRHARRASDRHVLKTHARQRSAHEQPKYNLTFGHALQNVDMHVHKPTVMSCDKISAQHRICHFKSETFRKTKSQERNIQRDKIARKKHSNRQNHQKEIFRKTKSPERDIQKEKITRKSDSQKLNEQK